MQTLFLSLKVGPVNSKAEIYLVKEGDDFQETDALDLWNSKQVIAPVSSPAITKNMKMNYMKVYFLRFYVSVLGSKGINFMHFLLIEPSWK